MQSHRLLNLTYGVHKSWWDERGLSLHITLLTLKILFVFWLVVEPRGADQARGLTHK